LLCEGAGDAARFSTVRSSRTTSTGNNVGGSYCPSLIGSTPFEQEIRIAPVFQSQSRTRPVHMPALRVLAETRWGGLRSLYASVSPLSLSQVTK